MAFADEAEARLAALLDHERRAAELDAELEAARGNEREAAAAVRAVRAAAAGALGDAVQARLAELAMGKARVEVAVGEEPPGDDVRLLLAANPGADLAPLAKVASGGELSRVSLAIQLVAARAAPVATLVFDEVDAGIGGAVADTIGRSLRKLGKQRQVLCVTHLPQVAAAGDAQWNVTKTSTRSEIQVKIRKLDRAARIEELARMLGGSESTARKHAAELLAAD